jgi:hypothetical protein
LKSWIKVTSAIGELVDVRKELGAGSHEEGVERCSQSQVRDRAQVVVCLILFLDRICLAIHVVSPLGFHQFHEDGYTSGSDGP